MQIKRLLISIPVLLGIGIVASWSELLWYATQLTDTPEAYANYIEEYPESGHVPLALSCIDELEWRLTESYEGVLGFEYYLDRLPDGPHAAEAKLGLQLARMHSALAEGSREAIEKHLDVYPEDAARPRVLALLEDLAWRELLALETSETIESFLAQHPDGKHASEAQAKLDQINFRRATVASSKDTWSAYIESGPPSEYLAPARSQLDELFWQDLESHPNVELARHYLANCVQERHRIEAQGILEELVWEDAQGAGTSAAILAYQDEFPDGLYAYSAVIQLEGIAWAEAISKGSPEALAAYVESYPEGSHVDELPRVQEQLLWGRAVTSDDLETYAEYVERFPKGPHAMQAQIALQPSPALALVAEGRLDMELNKIKSGLASLVFTLGPDAKDMERAETVELPKGTLFRSSDPKYADLLLASPLRLRLQPGQGREGRVPLAVVHGTQVGPLEVYDSAPGIDETLAALLDKLQGQRIQPAVMQLALSIAVDDLSFEQLAQLSSRPESTQLSILVAQAMQLGPLLGFDVPSKHVWSERALVRASLPDGELKAWLSHPESIGDAVRFGSVEQLGLLLQSGADPNVTGNSLDHSATPLGLAMEVNRLEIGRSLVASGADLGPGRDGVSILGAAVNTERAEWVRMLVEAGAKPSASGSNELIAAVSLGNLEITDLLLDAGAPIDGLNEYEVPLNEAAAAGQFESVKHLLAKGARVDVGVDTALMRAAENGHTRIVRSLLAAGAELDRAGKWGYTALHKAVEHGQAACVQALVQAGSNINLAAGGFRPIDLASFKSRALVDYLSQLGATETIFSVVAQGDVDGIERCFARGESLERWGTDSLRPLHVAVAMGQGEALGRLLGHGADVNARSTDGLQPLHLAAQAGWGEAIQVLVEAGADLDDVGYAGTPLQLAVRAGHLSAVGQLLQLGADPLKKRAQDPSALEDAMGRVEQDPKRYKPILKLLQKATAN